MPPERCPDDVTRAEAPPWRRWGPSSGKAKARAIVEVLLVAQHDVTEAERENAIRWVSLKERESKVGRSDTLAVSSLSMGDDRRSTILSASPSILSEYVDLDARDPQY